MANRFAGIALPWFSVSTYLLDICVTRDTLGHSLRKCRSAQIGLALAAVVGRQLEARRLRASRMTQTNATIRNTQRIASSQPGTPRMTASAAPSNARRIVQARQEIGDQPGIRRL